MYKPLAFVLFLAGLSYSQCVSDTQCSVTQFCDIPAGSSTGTCQNFTGQCGVAIDHYGYECGPEPGCPRCPGSSQCVNHKCVVISLSCPNLGLIGETKSCSATENNKSCVNCEYEITSPDGTTKTGKTDLNGSFHVLLTTEGAYRIALIRGGTEVKSAQVNSLTRMPEEENPSSFASTEVLIGLGILSLVVLLAAAVILWRTRFAKK